MLARLCYVEIEARENLIYSDLHAVQGRTAKIDGANIVALI